MELQQFISQVIHDEASASVDISMENVSRELEISESEYVRKKRIMEALCLAGKLNGGFVSCTLEKKKERESTYKMWTEAGAALTIQLSAYNGNKFYLGTRGSPTRLLTGQNVIEMRDLERVRKVTEKLKCTEFEARTVLAFSMVKKTVQMSLKEEMFVHNEWQDIKACRLNVATVGFATYWDFGNKRDEILHLLGYLGSYQVNTSGDSFSLLRLIGSLGCKTWRKVVDAGYQGPNQGVSITKYNRDFDGSRMFYQMMYLKDEEIASKKNVHNERIVADMAEAVAAAFRERFVRVDNVFFKEYLMQWVKTFRERVGLPALTGTNLLLRDVAHIMDNKQLVWEMCIHGANETGMRLLLQAPTMTQMNNLNLSKEKEELVEIWKQKCRAHVEQTRNGKVLRWPDVLGSDKNRRELAKELYNEHFLDLRVSYDFYVHLNEARAQYFMTPEERLALSHEMQGESDKYSKINIDTTKKRLRTEVNQMIGLLRKNVELTTSSNKKLIVSKHI